MTRSPAGNLLVAPSRDCDMRDVMAMFPPGGTFSEPTAYADGLGGLSFKYTGICCMCRAKTHVNSYYIFWSPVATRRLRTFSASCTMPREGERVPFQPRSLAHYQLTLENALDKEGERYSDTRAAAVYEVLRHYEVVRNASGDGEAAAWWDGKHMLYVRLPRLNKAVTYAAVQVDDADMSVAPGGTVLGGDDQCCRIRLTQKPWALDDRDGVVPLTMSTRFANALRHAISRP